MILPVRPHFIFDQINEDRSVTIPIPERNAGSPSLLETYVLIAVGKIVKPKRIFEIGTFQGQTTRNLSANFPHAEVFTLDLDVSRTAGITLSEGAPVHRLLGHSMSFNFCPYFVSCELIFVDGGHDYETVKSDSQNALKLRCSGATSAIVWHDYGHPLFPGVTQALNELDLPILHVGDTQMCVYFTP